MADMKSVNIPKPPSSEDPKEIYKWTVGVTIWLEQTFGSGNQATFLSTSQLSQVTQKEHTGKMFYSSDGNSFHGSVIEGGNVVVKKFTLT